MSSQLMRGAVANILEAVGHTPLVKLNRIGSHTQAEIYVKCEFMNPGGSIKDRMALNILKKAEGAGCSSRAAPSWRPPAATPAWALALVAAGARLQVHLHHARQDVAGEDRDRCARWAPRW